MNILQIATLAFLVATTVLGAALTLVSLSRQRIRAVARESLPHLTVQEESMPAWRRSLMNIDAKLILDLESIASEDSTIIVAVERHRNALRWQRAAVVAVILAGFGLIVAAAWVR